ncbi:MAG TPA: DoxX family protein [Euzebyales bacterium]
MIRGLARMALAVPFIVLGAEAAREPGPRVALAEDIGIPYPEEAVRFNGVAMVAGGLGLALRVLPRTAAAGLVASMIPTTLAGHRFWADDDPAARKGNRIQFLKNVGLIGGLLLASRAAEGD